RRTAGCDGRGGQAEIPCLTRAGNPVSLDGKCSQKHRGRRTETAGEADRERKCDRCENQRRNACLLRATTGRKKQRAKPGEAHGNTKCGNSSEKPESRCGCLRDQRSSNEGSSQQNSEKAAMFCLLLVSRRGMKQAFAACLQPLEPAT